MPKLTLSALFVLVVAVDTYSAATALGAGHGGALFLTFLSSLVIAAAFAVFGNHNNVSVGFISAALAAFATVCLIGFFTEGGPVVLLAGLAAACSALIFTAVFAKGVHLGWCLVVLTVEATGVGLALGLGSWLWAIPAALTLVGLAAVSCRCPGFFARA